MILNLDGSVCTLHSLASWVETHLHSVRLLQRLAAAPHEGCVLKSPRRIQSNSISFKPFFRKKNTKKEAWRGIRFLFLL